MGIALGRLAIALSRGVAGRRKNQRAMDQQAFENERQLAAEENSRAYREALAENQRAQVESINQQRMAARMAAQRAEAAKAQQRSRRIAALGRKGIYEPAIADDEVAFREAMNPKPKGPTVEEQLALHEGKAKIDARYRAPTQGAMPVQMVDAQGNTAFVDPRTGRTVARPETGLRSGGGATQQQPTEGERRIGALYAFAEPSAQRVLAKYSEGFSPSKMDRAGEELKGSWRPDWIGSLLQSDDAQMMYDDLTNVVLATQYALSGAAVTEPEARKLARSLMPSLADKPGRAAQKVEEINNRMRVLRMAAGRSMSQQPQQPRRPLATIIGSSPP